MKKIAIHTHNHLTNNHFWYYNQYFALIAMLNIKLTL